MLDFFFVIFLIDSFILFSFFFNRINIFVCCFIIHNHHQVQLLLQCITRRYCILNGFKDFLKRERERSIFTQNMRFFLLLLTIIHITSSLKQSWNMRGSGNHHRGSRFDVVGPKTSPVRVITLTQSSSHSYLNHTRNHTLPLTHQHSVVEWI